MKNFLSIILIVLLSSITSVGVYKYLEKDQNPLVQQVNQPQALEFVNAINQNNAVESPPPPTYKGNPVDFREAARVSTPRVVHISNKQAQRQVSGRSGSIFDYFFGEGMGNEFFYGDPNSESSGSGVIVSSDGYIVTNNHVIENSESLTVTLHNKKEYSATIVGVDPTTDLAVIKVDANDLPAMKYANSDNTFVGDWVLAVGNPFNLSSTVTAGIISAKGRDIDILKGNNAIESFIQTDAAVNPGNSGGALVNIDGDLVGINTAIATPTGTFAGYSFAVPVNIVQKIVADLKDFGIVQRAYLGVSISDVNNRVMEEYNLNSKNGIFIAEVMPNSAADDAGLREGDVINFIKEKPVNSAAQLQEQLARYRPGDAIEVGYTRNGQQKYARVVLKNIDKTTDIVKSADQRYQTKLGATFKDLSSDELAQIGIRNGVLVDDIKDGGAIKNETAMREGFIVLKVNNVSIRTGDDIYQILDRIPDGDGVMIEGIYPGDYRTQMYAFSLD